MQPNLFCCALKMILRMRNEHIICTTHSVCALYVFLSICRTFFFRVIWSSRVLVLWWLFYWNTCLPKCLYVFLRLSKVRFVHCYTKILVLKITYCSTKVCTLSLIYYNTVCQDTLLYHRVLSRMRRPTSCRRTTSWTATTRVEGTEEVFW